MMEQIFMSVHGWMSGGVLAAAAGCFLWGVISVVFSPCHLASIPIIVSYVAGQNEIPAPGRAAKYALAFTTGLFITIALVGIVCSVLGRMMGEIGPYWTPLVGGLLIWVALDMAGVTRFAVSGNIMGRISAKGLAGALVLGLAYGLLSGSCTFGFIAPVLAFITIQKQIGLGILYILLFGLGHCLPIALAGSSAALAQRMLDSRGFQKGSLWFRRAASLAIGGFGVYFLILPFLPMG